MPVSFVPPPDNTPRSIYDDVLVLGPNPPVFSVQIATEPPIIFPANFDSLPLEQREAFKNKLRFMGMRMRGDIQQPIRINRQTQDLP